MNKFYFFCFYQLEVPFSSVYKIEGFHNLNVYFIFLELLNHNGLKA